jgi:hypothetical protein
MCEQGGQKNKEQSGKTERRIVGTDMGCEKERKRQISFWTVHKQWNRRRGKRQLMKEFRERNVAKKQSPEVEGERGNAPINESVIGLERRSQL